MDFLQHKAVRRTKVFLSVDPSSDSVTLISLHPLLASLGVQSLESVEQQNSMRSLWNLLESSWPPLVAGIRNTGRSGS